MELKVSEKQVKWANSIRKDMIEALTFSLKFKNHIDKIDLSDKDVVKAKDTILNKIDELEERINGNNSKWFIENREIIDVAFSVTKQKVFSFDEIFKNFDYEKENVDDFDLLQTWNDLYSITLNIIEKEQFKKDILSKDINIENIGDNEILNKLKSSFEFHYWNVIKNTLNYNEILEIYKNK